ncbi:adenosine deaminase [Cyphellophora europaea CBS 101466]|uniref:Adenine deaminase n=1 Tax=Cyphellophora europaea (strain CBS 101466) TaxID=1220924 RepID=W2S4P0_CYPE1|nr:adenosine deaminase [Cyphellophora europaea CBS 101466]ETN43013.1 adenosine deaminase [Cyphellophora europaea CBS 101466]
MSAKQNLALSALSGDDLETFVADMPKAELHVHLEGCLTPDLVRELAARNNMPPPPGLASLDKASSYDFHDLTSFLAIYYPNMTVLQTAEDFCDLALSYLSIASSHNVRHCELFFDPQAHTSRGVSFDTVITGYNRGLQLASQKYGISASLVLCLLRDESPSYGMSTLVSSLPYRHLIAGLGLDSDERNNPPSKFSQIYARARQEGYHLTAHCDIDQANTLTHIRQALLDLQVDRIDHGTNILDDAELVDLIRSRNIGLTCCPVSNSIVTADAKFPAMLALLRQGVKVTVNSDDPAYFRAYLNENILKMARETDVTRRELVLLQRNAFHISWISTWQRQKLLQELEEYELKTLGKASP